MEKGFDILFKVKYGETLRRFQVLALCEETVGKEKFMEKFCRLLDLPSNADLKMTYVDEDGDVVTLVDGDDLFDIIRQKLKPVRIYVELSDEMNKHPHSGLRGVICSSCGTNFIPEIISKSTGQESLDLCPMCCSKIGTENDNVGTANQSGVRQRSPSSQVVHDQNPGLGPRSEPPVTRKQDPFLLASLVDKLSRNNISFSAAGTSTGPHATAWDKKLPAVSSGLPPLFENSIDRRDMEIRLAQMAEEILGRIGKCKRDAALDDRRESRNGIQRSAVVERLLEKNNGNMRRTLLAVLAGEKA